MRRRSATAGLISEASRVIHMTVGVLSDSECGVSMRTGGTIARGGCLVNNVDSEIKVGVGDLALHIF